jgi:hypothetical protein
LNWHCGADLPVISLCTNAHVVAGRLQDRHKSPDTFSVSGRALFREGGRWFLMDGNLP